MIKMNKKGFTLVELIVVMAIIGILAAVLIPGIKGYVAKAKENANYQEAMFYKRSLDNAILEGAEYTFTRNNTADVAKARNYDSFVTTDQITVNVKTFLTSYLGSFPDSNDIMVTKESDVYILTYVARGITTHINLETVALLD